MSFCDERGPVRSPLLGPKMSTGRRLKGHLYQTNRIIGLPAWKYSEDARVRRVQTDGDVQNIDRCQRRFAIGERAHKERAEDGGAHVHANASLSCSGRRVTRGNGPPIRVNPRSRG